jgi:hypothetical protein
VPAIVGLLDPIAGQNVTESATSAVCLHFETELAVLGLIGRF